MTVHEYVPQAQQMVATHSVRNVAIILALMLHNQNRTRVRAPALCKASFYSELICELGAELSLQRISQLYA